MDTTALKKSAELLRKAKRLEPDRLEIHERLAKVFTLLLPLLSETELSHLGTRTKCRQEFFWLSDFYHQKKDLSKARRQLEDWTQLQKDDLEACTRLAELHEEAGDKTKATAVFSEIAEQHLKQGQTAEARGALEKAIQLDPGRTDLRRRLIEIHEEIGSQQQSLQERFSLAETFLDQGNREEAKAECRRLQPAAKGNRHHLERLAELCQRLDDRPVAYSLFLELVHQANRQEEQEVARGYAEKAQALAPDEPVPYELLADLHLQSNRKEEAAAQFRQLADLYRRKKSTRRLVTTLRQLLRIDENDTPAREEVIECLSRQGNIEAVNAERITLARIYKQLGKGEEALHQYHRVLEKNPYHLKIICEAAELQRQTDSPESALQFYLEQAKTLDRLGARPESEQLLQRARAIDSNHIETLEYLADLYQRMERNEPAIECLDLLTRIYLEQDQVQPAIQQLLTIVQISPDQTDYRNQLAVLYLKKGQKDKAVEIWIDAANRLIRMNRRDEAEKILIEACSHQPQDTNLQQTLIQFYEENRQYEQAGQYRQALAEQLLAQQQPEKAAEQLSEALIHSPNPVPLLNQVVSIYRQIDDVPHQIEFLRLLAEQHQKAKRWQEWIETLESLLGLEPNDLEALHGLTEARFQLGDRSGGCRVIFQRAALLMEQGRSREAIDLYRQGLEIDTGNIEVHRRLIEALIRTHAQEEAIAELKALARILSAQNEIEAAVEAIEEAVKLQPDNPRLRQEYAEVLKSANLQDQALEQYLKIADLYEALHLIEKALEILGVAKSAWPDCLDIGQRLADLYSKEGLERSATRELHELAEKLLESGNLAQAQTTLQQLLQIDSQALGARILLADTLTRLNKIEEASVEYLSIAGQQVSAGEFESAAGSLQKIQALPLQYHPEKDRIQQEIENQLRRSALEKRMAQVEELLRDHREEEAVSTYEVLLEDYPENVDVVVGFARLKNLCGDDEESLSLFIEAADRCRRAGHLRRATGVLNEILQIWPESEPALERLIQIEESSGRIEEAGNHLLQIAKIKEKTGRLDLAITLCEKILALDRFSAEARGNLARLLSVLGRNEEAYQHQLALGDLLREKDQLQEAIAAFQEASRMLPEDARCHKKLADLLDQTNNPEEAMEQNLKAAEIDWQSGHRQEARRTLTGVLKKSPDHIAARRLAIRFADDRGETKEALNERKALAVIYLKKQQPKRAISILREVVQADPKDISSRRILAQELEKEGLFEEAVQEQLQIGDLYNERGISGKAISFYRMAQKRMEDPIIIHEKIAQTYLKENLKDKAIAEMMTLAGWFQEQNRQEEAVEVYQKTLDADPGNLRVLNKMAKCYEETRRTDQAAGVYRQIVETYVERGLLGKALETCRKALTVVPHDITLRERLAEMLTRKGSLEEAKKEYENILRYSPGDIRISGLIDQLSGRISGESNKKSSSPRIHPQTTRSGGASRYMSQVDPYSALESTSPEAISARGQEGLKLFAHKRYTRAIEELTAAINLWKQNPTDREKVPEYFNTLGICYLEIHKPGAAVEILLQGIGTVDPKDEKTLLEMRYSLAQAYEMLDQNAEALKLWKAIYTVNRNYKDVANKILWSRIASKKKNA